jgi:hypothetical protein
MDGHEHGQTRRQAFGCNPQSDQARPRVGRIRNAVGGVITFRAMRLSVPAVRSVGPSLPVRSGLAS